MMRSLYIIILFFPIVLYGQCLEGDCVNDWGIKQTETIKYVGTFSKGLFISGEVYYVEYNEVGENLYSKYINTIGYIIAHKNKPILSAVPLAKKIAAKVEIQVNIIV